MQKVVIQNAIQHYLDLLETAVAREDRERLEALLAAERAKLEALGEAGEP